MLWTIGVILLVLWALGLFSGYTLGESFTSFWSSPHCGGDPIYSRAKTIVAIWALAGQGEMFTERSNRYEKEKYVYRLSYASDADRQPCGLCIDIQTGKHR
jgi:hypothetical protein